MEPTRKFRARHRTRQVIELVTAALLSLGGASTTYCSYQASVWGGRMAGAYTRAEAIRTESAKVASHAGQLALVDVTSFVAWLQAHVKGEQKLEAALRARLRPEFRPAFEEWLATDPLNVPSAPPTPFGMPSYDTTGRTHSEALEKTSDGFFAEGQYANAQSDSYLLSTVIFGMSLFFAGIGHQFRRLLLQLTMLGASALLVGWGIYRLTLLPHARPEPVAPSPIEKRPPVSVRSLGPVGRTRLWCSD
jgi:hypothetical protein